MRRYKAHTRNPEGPGVLCGAKGPQWVVDNVYATKAGCPTCKRLLTRRKSWIEQALEYGKEDDDDWCGIDPF